MSARVRVKFCGITRLEDAVAAAQLGVDAIGMVFVPASKRAIDAVRAREILAAMPPLVTSVALFMDAPVAAVHAVLDAIPVDLLQFHGSESPDYCAQFQRPWIKALAMGGPVDALAEARRYAGARGLLLDAHRAGEQGGRGEAFNWASIPVELAPRILLAGGLTEHNVARAIEVVRPFAVDVSSGIESAPGIKCPARMQKFIDEVSRAK